MSRQTLHTQGFSLVEVIIVSAISAMVFGALFGSFYYILQVINLSEAKLSAQSVANDRMEFFRSLPYDDVGTIAGIPSGTIPQNSTTSLNSIEFAERVLVEYVDDDADGFGILDSNGILSDYKRLKLEYTWEIAGVTDSISLISNIVPRSIETTAGGGTVRINVLDADSTLLPGAEVRLFNNTTTSTIDVARFTDASGAALFSGAPAASDYEVVVTADISGQRYSTTQTYRATTSNPNPAALPFAVLEADISTLTFQIGELSDMSITTFSDITEDVFTENFNDLFSVASSTDVVAAGGELELADVAGVYESSGIAYLGPITPASLLEWNTITINGDRPANTNYKVQLFTAVTSTGPFILISDSELAGNSLGFNERIIDITELDVATYPSVYIGVLLETTNTTVTPEVEEISIYYRESQTVLPSVDMVVTGNKTIGTSTSSAPIYKFSTTTTSDLNGESELVDIEFDTYTFDFSSNGYDIATACEGHPYVQTAGVDGNPSFELVADAAHTVRVVVTDLAGRYIPGATVEVSRPGYNTAINTNSCGQAFFSGGLGIYNDYEVEVSALGYTTETLSNYDVDGDMVASVTISE
jgi:prepilin-type N-terminal cleavage/methylation domain-containing protein